MIVIIDYRMGNVGSVKNALRALGRESKIACKKDDIRLASHIILPGVGAFGDGMENLKKNGLVDILHKEVFERKKPFLGICLGMQMLATLGKEGGDKKGLGWISGVVIKLNSDGSKLRLPHVGWNDITPVENSMLFRGIKRPIFYFVHSYYLVPDDNSIISGYCEYGAKFAAAIEKDNIFGVQFHPEKSQQEGLKVLENFLQFNPY